MLNAILSVIGIVYFIQICYAMVEDIPYLESSKEAVKRFIPFYYTWKMFTKKYDL